MVRTLSRVVAQPNVKLTVENGTTVWMTRTENSKANVGGIELIEGEKHFSCTESNYLFNYEK